MKKKAIVGLIGTVAVMSVGTIMAMADNILVSEDSMYSVEVGTMQENTIQDSDFRIRELKNNGILIGDERGNLNLEGNLKRQEMVVLISRLMGKEEEAKKWDTSKLTFEDVAKDNWAAGYIAWAKDNNITKGYSEEWFGYNDTLTATQTGMFLLRVLGYNDVEMSQVNEKAMEKGLINFNEILLEEAIKRGKVAELIYNAIYTTKANSEKTLGEEINVKTDYTEEERKMAIALIPYGIECNRITDSEEWKIIYVNLNGKEINKENVKEDLELFYEIGRNVGYSHYVLIDSDTNQKIEVINYVEYGVIYQIEVNDEVIYKYVK